MKWSWQSVQFDPTMVSTLLRQTVRLERLSLQRRLQALERQRTGGQRATRPRPDSPVWSDLAGAINAFSAGVAARLAGEPSTGVEQDGHWDEAWDAIVAAAAGCDQLIGSDGGLARPAEGQASRRPDGWESFFGRLREAWNRWYWRLTHVPVIHYEGDLPVHARVSEIVAAIQTHQVLVVCGETGSGKSTQLPKLCLQAGYGRTGLIGHTQPRRIAARSVAARVAEELGVRLGAEVGYKIRFHDDTNPQSFVKLMTDGILLAETQSDRDFDQYDLIIIDEAHERSLNIDFLLGYLKQVCQRRPEFRLIITSATIDAQRFAAHFADAAGQPAPVIAVEGRGYPVEIQYRAPEMEDGRWTNPEQSVLRAVEQMAARDRGHMLVFLPTERDILSVSRKLRDLRLGRDAHDPTEVIPLYARLSVADQQRIFQPTAARRIVLATNVAESSLTVPGIKYVIDTGTARISRYSARSKVQRLPIEAISQASANQRAGRCGRVGPGVCVRLYSEDDFQAREPFTTPEIRRTNLASVILQAKLLELGPLQEFPFLDPPRPEALSEGEKSLFEIGAIDAQGHLTVIGRQLGKLPLDPRIGRMILEAAQQGCLQEILIIAAAIEVPDPRVRPVELAAAADQAHRQFLDKRSDFMAYLKLWQFYHEEKEKRSKTQFRKYLHANFISPERMQQWLDVHRQLRQVVRELRLPLVSAPSNYASIHRSLLAGLLSGIAMLDEKEPKLKQYLGPGNVKFQLWPGSGLDRLPKWVMVAEIVETSRNFGRTVASIEPGWIEPLAKHLVHRRYSEPRWNPKSCGVTANERVTLFGLPIIPRRRVPYGRIDPRESQLLMFAEGFFLGHWEQPAPEFLQRNWQTQRELQGLCQKSRRLDWVIDEQRVVDFYADRLPADVVDAATLNRFLKQAGPEQAAALELKLSDVIRVDDDYRPEDYPSVLDVGTMSLPLTYNFQPGENGDGVFVQVPVEAVGQLSDQRLAWCVPGWLETKIVQMIRSLPKSVRRNLVPAPDTAKRVAAALTFGQGSLYQEVASRLAVEAELPLTLADFDLEKIDAYLTMGIRVVSEDGTVLAAGRSVAMIRRQLEELGVNPGNQIQDRSWQITGQTDWTFGTLPESVRLQRGPLSVEAFPAIVDEGETVGTALFDSAPLAANQHELGIVRLLRLTHHKQLRRQVRELPDLERSKLLLGRWLSTAQLEEGLESVLVKIALQQSPERIREEKRFRQIQQHLSGHVGGAAIDLTRWLPTLAAAVHQVDQRLADLKTNPRFIKSFNDARTQIRALLAEGFLKVTPWSWLQHLPRYVTGIDYRLQRLDAETLIADLQRIEAVAEYWTRYQQQQELTRLENRIDPELEVFRWWLEEYRISLFAQPLGTSLKVSPQRLEKQWSQVQANVALTGR
jgi:ATP-dependent helicase HrpA